MANPTPALARGVLNRIRANIVFPDFPAMNIAPENMGRSMVRVAFEGQLVTQIPTGTGAVNSPEPFVFVTITVGMLRTQPIAAAWLNQIMTNSSVQNITAHPDTSAFPPIALQDVVVSHIDPGPYDGTNPEVPIIFRGLLPVNNDLWSYA